MSNVYVIAARGGPVKIGIAKDPEARLRSLITGTPFALRVAHVIDPEEFSARQVETEVHNLLSAARTHGEWFSISPDEARDAIVQVIHSLRFPSASKNRLNDDYVRVIVDLPKDLSDWISKQADRILSKPKSEIVKHLQDARDREMANVRR